MPEDVWVDAAAALVRSKRFQQPVAHFMEERGAAFVADADAKVPIDQPAAAVRALRSPPRSSPPSAGGARGATERATRSDAASDE